MLAHGVDVTKNTHADTLFIVNTAGDNASLPFAGRKVLSVDALGIALEVTGNEVPNAPMLGAMAAAGLVDLEAVTTTILKRFGAHGPANADAARRAYAETRSN